MKYIFLDIDGVLHSDDALDSPMFEHMDLFCHAIKPYLENIMIIISSSWRENYRLDGLKALFPASVRHVIKDVTPCHIDGMNYHGRYKEIMAYCNEKSIGENQWIAIDDMAMLFPKNCPNLILTVGFTGLRTNDILKLEAFLKKSG